MLAFDDCQALDLVGPVEVFSAANQLDKDSYSVQVASLGGAEITTSSGLRLASDLNLLSTRRHVDTLVVAGGAGTRRAASNPKVLRAVTRLATRARRVTSVCTGAFVLAAAGMLRNRRATTHWAYCAKLATMFPSVQVNADAIFVRDGNVWTSAGVTAGMDLALALVEQDLGRQAALTIARHLVLFVKRPGGQSQFSAQLAGQLAERDSLRELQTWILENLDSDLRVSTLAQRVGMSPRNFARVFRQQVGIAPAQFVEKTRIECSKRLLETTTLSMPAAAEAAGFATADVFRRAFSRQLGVSPTDYRARFSTPKKELRS